MTRPARPPNRWDNFQRCCWVEAPLPIAPKPTVQRHCSHSWVGGRSFKMGTRKIVLVSKRQRIQNMHACQQRPSLPPKHRKLVIFTPLHSVRHHKLLQWWDPPAHPTDETTFIDAAELKRRFQSHPLAQQSKQVVHEWSMWSQHERLESRSTGQGRKCCDAESPTQKMCDKCTSDATDFVYFPAWRNKRRATNDHINTARKKGFSVTVVLQVVLKQIKEHGISAKVVDGIVPETTKVKESPYFTNLKMSPCQSKLVSRPKTLKFSAGTGNKKYQVGQEPCGICGVVGLVEVHHESVEGARVKPCTRESARGCKQLDDTQHDSCQATWQKPRQSKMKSKPMISMFASWACKSRRSRHQTRTNPLHLSRERTSWRKNTDLCAVFPLKHLCPWRFSLRLCGPP